MFRAHSAHHQKVNDANCTYAASGIVTLCRWPAGHLQRVTIPAGHLQRVTIPEAAYVQFASLTFWWWAECARNTYRNLIYCNLCKWTRNLCTKLVIIKTSYRPYLFFVSTSNLGGEREISCEVILYANEQLKIPSDTLYILSVISRCFYLNITHIYLWNSK